MELNNPSITLFSIREENTVVNYCLSKVCVRKILTSSYFMLMLVVNLVLNFMYIRIRNKRDNL